MTRKSPTTAHLGTRAGTRAEIARTDRRFSGAPDCESVRLAALGHPLNDSDDRKHCDNGGHRSVVDHCERSVRRLRVRMLRSDCRRQRQLSGDPDEQDRTDEYSYVLGDHRCVANVDLERSRMIVHGFDRISASDKSEPV